MPSMTHVGPVDSIPALYKPETARQLIAKGYTISVQVQKTGWLQRPLWTVFVSVNGKIMPPQIDLKRDCLNAVLDSLERVAGCV